MSKKTMVFYSPADESKILKAYVSNKGKDRKKALEAIATSLGRPYAGIYAKALALSKKEKKGKVRHMKTSPLREAKVSGSTIRFPFRGIELDAAAGEIVVKL